MNTPRKIAIGTPRHNPQHYANYDRVTVDHDYRRKFGVMGRGSRRGLSDYRRRFRVQMRAAARCNVTAAVHWADIQGHRAVR